jgi:tetratricopeptide (TPR) repeat protein
VSAAVLLLLLALAPAGGRDDLDDALRALDAADPATYAQALEELELAGAPAAQRALEGFSERSPVARRARARLVVEVAAPESIDGVLGLLDDPDPEVRRLLARFLGQIELASARAAERVDALRSLAGEDADRRVRLEALDSLGRASLPGTAGALDELLRTAVRAEVPEVAHTLVDLASGRARLVGRVRGAFAGEGAASLEDDVLAILLSGYGRALAELPRGGGDPSERVPLVLGHRHPSSSVRVASRLSLGALTTRLFELGEHERSEEILRALGDEGLPRHDLLYRRVELALLGDGDAETAYALARDLERAAGLAPHEDRSTFRFFAIHLMGVARFASGDVAAARERFTAAARLLEAQLEERPDLRASQSSRVGGAIMVNRLQLLALEGVWGALAFLAEGLPPSDARVLELLRSSHEALLKARVMNIATDAGSDASSIDTLLDRDLAPGPLVLFNRQIERWSDGRGYDLLRSFGRAMATVAPWELPGFEPVDPAQVERRLRDPLSDPRRFELLVRVRSSLYESWQRQAREIADRSGAVDQGALRALEAQRGAIRRHESEESQRLMQVEDVTALDDAELLEIFFNLVSVTTTPSLFGLTLGNNLRADGRSAEARAIGERMLVDLRRGLPGSSDVWTEWGSARVELMLGSSYMDDGDPAEAERICQNAVDRLQQLENTLVARLGSGEAARRDGTVRQLRALRGNALLSMAVNANVRMDDQERALGFFERAYELDQRDFMQVLLACYRARSGRAAEARAVLEGIQPAPPLYYNLACTYALLGDTELAVDYLRRELGENHPTAASLAKQKAWAAGDPDLASLREDPGFQRLVESD